jgi:hypothetical protein
MITEKQLVEYHILDNQSAVIYALMEANKINEDAIIYDSDVLEWWLVTSHMARWLKAQDEVIIEDLGCCWWGRTTSGQAIYIDGVISDIAKTFN